MKSNKIFLILTSLLFSLSTTANEIELGKPTLRNLNSGKEKSIEIKELVNEIKKII